MATVVDRPVTQAGRTGLSAPAEFEDKPFRPVKMWAAIGVAFFLVEGWALWGWITGPNFKSTPTGVTPVPLYMTIAIRGWEICAFPAFFLFLWHFLIKPWKREGKIQSDGLFCLVFATIWWQDPVSNFIAPYFTYNAKLVNFGTWLNNIPGWQMPGAHKIAEAPIWTFPIYVYLVFGACVVGNIVMRKAKQRWPQLTKAQLCLVCFAAFFCFDIVLEPFLMFIGIWTYTGVVAKFTLFYGHYYQFPMYEALLWGGVWTMWSCLRYFKDDKGHTIVERGIDELKISPKSKTVVRFLALAGVCNFMFLFAYNIPGQIFILNADPINHDQLTRSYFMSGICGEGTDYACYGKDLPFPRVGSAHVRPDGSLSVPPGANFTPPPYKR